MAPVALPARALRAPGEEREVGAGLGDAQDALLRALRNGGRERVRVAAAVEQAEVVAAGAASGDLQRVALHPGARVDRLVVGDRGPRGDELARLLLHPLELRPLVQRRVPRQHHAADLLVVLAVADHRDAAAAGVAASWAKKLISSTRLPNCSSSAATSSSSSGSETTTSRHFFVGIPTA